MKYLLLLVTLFCSACQCWTPQHAQDPGCVVARGVVSCTESTLVPALVTLFSGLISTGQLTPDQAAQQAEQFGFKDGGCFLAMLEQALGSKLGKEHPHAKRTGDLFFAWKQKHEATNLKFKILVDGKEIFR